MSKTIIVSNRLPIKIQKNHDGLTYKPSAGGLATGLGSIYKEGNNIWLGWAGLYLENSTEEKQVTEDLQKESLKPVFLTEAEVEGFYEGFSNATLWPSFHYFPQYAVYNDDCWESYQQVNQKFAKAILDICGEDDIVWIHDYQLLLVPQLIREQRPNISIGYFQHIPFPSYEIFRLLPWRRELLLGMLGADLLGFHTYDDMRHFLSSVNRLAGMGYFHGEVEVDNRKVVVDAFPMGIDYDKYAQKALAPDTINREVRYRSSLNNEKMILSIDRLDYSKGIKNRLQALEIFFEQYPEYLEKVVLFMIVVPSRDTVPRYQALKTEIDELVGRINGKYGRVSWTPVHYFYRSFPLEALSAFYRMANVALVTPLRDGMNLVCKEYIASRADQTGVLILSEMAGSSKELSDAILINPNDIKQIVAALHEALTMPEEEQKLHMEVMQNSLKRYNIHHWVKLFLERLKEVKEQQAYMHTKILEKNTIHHIKTAYQKAEKRLLFLDYDGTLTGFAKKPEQAKPNTELFEILTNLTKDPKNKVVIISGRKHHTLEEWFGHLDMDLIAEHGIWSKESKQDWEVQEGMSSDWQKEIYPVMDLYVNRTPGAFVEQKAYSLVWHYRKVEVGLGELRTRELSSHLKYLTHNMGLQVLEGNMVVEIKPRSANKGVGAAKWLQKFPSDFIIALGDDKTDEDTFKAMPENAFTIKVGTGSSEANYYLNSVTEVRQLLKELINE